MSIVPVLTGTAIIAIAAMALTTRGAGHPPANQQASTTQPVFACRLGALTPQQRAQQKELTAQLERATTRVTEDAEG